MTTDDYNNDVVNVGAEILMALSAAAGVAGCLMWDVGPAFFFAPLGLAGAALVLLLASIAFLVSFETGTKVQPMFVVVAAVAIVISGIIGFSKKHDLNELSDKANQSLQEYDY